jgi:hypothetical protein
MLPLPCMSATLDEIIEVQDRLRREIAERECLLAVFGVLQGYVTNGRGPKSIEPGSLVSQFLPTAAFAPKQLPESSLAIQSAPPPKPVAVPPKPLYMHPELEVIPVWKRNNGVYVSWAIKRLTEDFTLRDVAAELKREGRPLATDQISVVLSRLKGRKEIEVVSRGRGRKATVFRKPADAAPVGEKTFGEAGERDAPSSPTVVPITEPVSLDAEAA